MGYLATAAVLIALIAFAALHLWLRHQRRVMIHQERLAALDKGITLPSVESEVRRGRLSVQRVLLLAGVVWIALGVGIFGLFKSLAGYSTTYFSPHNPALVIPHGLEWIGVAVAGIGIAHLVAYLAGRRKED